MKVDKIDFIPTDTCAYGTNIMLMYLIRLVWDQYKST